MSTWKTGRHDKIDTTRCRVAELEITISYNYTTRRKMVDIVVKSMYLHRHCESMRVICLELLVMSREICRHIDNVEENTVDIAQYFAEFALS